jgi:hypothetical protein
MRWFQLEWRWVILAQIYAITLFEANALRAGGAHIDFMGFSSI